MKPVIGCRLAAPSHLWEQGAEGVGTAAGIQKRDGSFLNQGHIVGMEKVVKLVTHEEVELSRHVSPSGQEVENLILRL